jgi:hypothetical protein
LREDPLKFIYEKPPPRNRYLFFHCSVGFLCFEPQDCRHKAGSQQNGSGGAAASTHASRSGQKSLRLKVGEAIRARSAEETSSRCVSADHRADALDIDLYFQ